MVNHPTAQQQRRVTICRLQDEGQCEWDEMVRILNDTVGIVVTLNSDESSMTLMWEAPSDEDPQVLAVDELISLEASAAGS